MTTTADTERLIRSLASRAKSGGPALRPTLAAATAAGTAIALTAALALLSTWVGLEDAVHQRWLYQKLLCMAAIAGGAWPLIEDLSAPERRRPRAGALAAALVLLLASGLANPGVIGLAGRTPSSAVTCMSEIVALSLPVLALVLAGLRKAAAPTRPAMAGAVAGLLAGALGGFAYAFACRNDGGMFIFIWYGSALTIAAALGAASGRVVLAW